MLKLVSGKNQYTPQAVNEDTVDVIVFKRHFFLSDVSLINISILYALYIL